MTETWGNITWFVWEANEACLPGDSSINSQFNIFSKFRYLSKILKLEKSKFSIKSGI